MNESSFRDCDHSPYNVLRDDVPSHIQNARKKASDMGPEWFVAVISAHGCDCTSCASGDTLSTIGWIHALDLISFFDEVEKMIYESGRGVAIELHAGSSFSSIEEQFATLTLMMGARGRDLPS